MFFNPFDFQLKNVANTGVVHWAGKLLALYEVSIGKLIGLLHPVEQGFMLNYAE